MTDTSDATEQLPPFSGDDPQCAKCGNRGATTMYMRDGYCNHPLVMGEIGGKPNERLHRRCTRCGYLWDEAITENT